MATYIDLCNLVLGQLNEVQFTAATFSSPTGFHKHVKDAINFAHRDIAQAEIEWPFSYQNITKTLTAEVNTIAVESDMQRIDWESFHLVRDDNLADGAVIGRHLEAITFDEFNIYHRAIDEQNNTGIRLPIFIWQSPDNLTFGITPIPDRAYQINYSYFGFETELVNNTDVSAVPDRFRKVVFHGAMYYAYLFRDNQEAALLALDKFEDGVKNMRTILMNKYLRVNDTRINFKGSGRFNRGLDLA